MPLKGLAYASDFPQDLRALACDWFYTWSGFSYQLGRVPMSRAGLPVPDLPADYPGWLLVFNEPNQPEPFGCELSPTDALTRYAALIDTYPQAKMIVGGVSPINAKGEYGHNWLYFFNLKRKAANLKPPAGWAMHGYVQNWITPAHLFSWWTKARALVAGRFWITEFGDISGSLRAFESLVIWLKAHSWIDRYAAYTNRQPEDQPWIISPHVELVYSDGSLKPNGLIYRSA